MARVRAAGRTPTWPDGILECCRGATESEPQGVGRQPREDGQGAQSADHGGDRQDRCAADARAFSEQEWAHRYALEGQVEALLCAEEEYWQWRSGLKWTLKGDANTKYFHAYANGRRRKCAILRLQSEQGLLLRQEDIS